MTFTPLSGEVRRLPVPSKRGGGPTSSAATPGILMFALGLGFTFWGLAGLGLFGLGKPISPASPGASPAPGLLDKLSGGGGSGSF